jgi:hypothetical protein
MVLGLAMVIKHSDTNTGRGDEGPQACFFVTIELKLSTISKKDNLRRSWGVYMANISRIKI